MIIDLAEHPPEPTGPRDRGPYDICIVGSGPAGGTLAAELAGAGLRVCVLESGRQRVSAYGDRLRATESSGMTIKPWSRERVFGGASTTWAGLSAPLDPIDFVSRAEYAVPGWPIERAELEPYWRAAVRYDFPAPEAFEDSGFGALRDRGDDFPELPTLDEKVFLAAQPPQNFSKLVRDVYAQDDVDLLLDATALEVLHDGGRARGVRASTSGGVEFELEARAVILATGGIENARLLLLSGGLGNEHDMVGRCFMNHPKNYHGLLELHEPIEELPYFFGCMTDGFAGYAGLRLIESTQLSEGLLNSYVRFEPLFPWSDNEGVESLVLLAKKSKLAVRALSPKRKGKITSLRDYSETGDDSELQNERRDARGWMRAGFTVLRHSPSVLSYLWYRLIPGQRPKIKRVRLRNFMEMEPALDNRVTLSEAVDEHGRPLPMVQHRCTALDRRSLIALHAELQRALTSVGRVETSLAEFADADVPWPIDRDASHHEGTTRMGDDPATSVVDRDLRVHGVENLYCAGASVFPTSGCANPTYTLCALSIRLAEHLRARMVSPKTAEATP